MAKTTHFGLNFHYIKTTFFSFSKRSRWNIFILTYFWSLRHVESKNISLRSCIFFSLLSCIWPTVYWDVMLKCPSRKSGLLFLNVIKTRGIPKYGDLLNMLNHAFDAVSLKEFFNSSKMLKSQTEYRIFMSKLSRQLTIAFRNYIVLHVIDGPWVLFSKRRKLEETEETRGNKRKLEETRGN